jgi:hypothetical protein
VLELATSILARLEAVLLPRRADPIVIPIRRDDWRGPLRGDRRH